ncbi:hypothetical protein ABRY95_12220 [Castellaniella ginsengisoli]|uniref:Uncharacterized protein n=1 Tax=Castellaniella ginsengisoli TaxID=546114 RepID=A0AB39EL44_9BURK
MQALRSIPAGAAVLFSGAVAGSLIALYGYLVPLTGVTGTKGALLAVIVSVVIALMAIALPRLRPGALRTSWLAVLVCLLAGNAFAGVLLHEPWLGIAMTGGLLGLIFDRGRPARTARHSPHDA